VTFEYWHQLAIDRKTMPSHSIGTRITYQIYLALNAESPRLWVCHPSWQRFKELLNPGLLFRSLVSGFEGEILMNPRNLYFSDLSPKFRPVLNLKRNWKSRQRYHSCQSPMDSTWSCLFLLPARNGAHPIESYFGGSDYRVYFPSYTFARKLFSLPQPFLTFLTSDPPHCVYIISIWCPRFRFHLNHLAPLQRDMYGHCSRKNC
jgi:hypothetical protein